MKRLICIATLMSGVVLAAAQGVQPNWTNTESIHGYDIVPRSMLVQQISEFVYAEYVGVCAIGTTGGGLNGGLLNLQAGQAFPITMNNSGSFVPGLNPVDVALNPTYFQMVGKLQGANTQKLQYLGSTQGNQAGVSGDLDYTYRPDATSIDQPLALGRNPYSTYAAANVQTGIGAARQLVVLQANSGTPNPIVAMTDTSIAPSMAAFSSNLILAAGADNTAGTAGGARATAYKINTNGSVSLAFTVTSQNTLANHVFTRHSLLWGTLSNTFNVLVDNKLVHDGNASTYSYSYTLSAYDGTGNHLWTSTSRTGQVLQLSVGSHFSIYALGDQSAAGEFLTSYGSNGVLRWNRSSQAVRIAAALDQGVVVGDNLTDGTGHHHVHITKFAENGSTSWVQTYASAAANDDFLYELQWITGHIFIAGQYVPATGNKGVFGAEYDQT